MADKQISQLTAATQILPPDLFVLEQDGTAKKLTGQLLVSWLTNYADGHGGIQTIAKTSTSGLVDTYTITYADTTTSTFTVTNGAKGDTGDAWYIHIRYAADLPTSDNDMGDSPDNYIGIYSGTSDTAPEHYTDYEWYQWKGDKGDTGEPARIVSNQVGYLVGQSGTTPPEGTWPGTVPTVPQGSYLWSRTRLQYNDGTVVVTYSCARNGVDGLGSVSSVNDISPDGNGNVALTADDIPCDDDTSVQNHIDAVEESVSTLESNTIRHITANLTQLPASFGYNWITIDHRVINCVFGTPSAITGDVTWTTSPGDVTFIGTMSGSTTIDFDIVKTVNVV